MATGDEAVSGPADRTNVETEQGIQVGGERIPLAPLPPAPPETPVDISGRVRAFEWLLGLLLLAFAFLCGSFRATNADVFLHLAAGRLIAAGQYTFGTDPFTFTSAGTWVNTSWLYGLVTYLLYTATAHGGVVLVVLKAVLGAATAWLMLRAGSLPGRPAWIPLACAFVGVLALSQRLLLQPAVVSMLLLALTLFLLTRADRWSLRLVPLVCLLWVNVDAWFLLGPVTVLLFAVGQFIQRTRATPGEDVGGPSPTALLVVLAASVVACLVNPFHIRVFTVLPVGLIRTGGTEALATDSYFVGYFLSPFLNADIYFQPTFGLSGAGIAYLVLLVAGLLSFVLTLVWQPSAVRWWRVLVWLAFALLSGLNIRGIPFFAVVAAPITALNFLDLAGRLVSPAVAGDLLYQRWALSGRLLTVVAAIALIVASVPGWLHPPHFRRAVAWDVEVDEGLKQAALRIQAWRDSGVLEAGQHWFNLTPEVGNYLAWFCPGERAYLDQRLELYGESAADFVAVRREINGDRRAAEQGDEPREPAWRRVFEERRIPFLFFYTADANRALPALLRLYANADEFVPCFLEGNAAIFAWRDPRPGKGRPVDTRLRLDFPARAFGSDPVKAPESPPRTAGTLPWWQELLTPDAATPTAAASAMQQFTRFEALSLRYRQRNERTYLAAAFAGLVGVPAAAGGPVPGGMLLPLRMTQTYAGMLGQPMTGPRTPVDQLAAYRAHRFVIAEDQGPPSALYLAIREGRQGLAAAPDDVLAELILAEAYNRLAYRTRERTRTVAVSATGQAQTFFPHVPLIRQTQVAAALRNVLKLNPRPDRQQNAHRLLSEVFHEPEYFEPQVHHMKEYLRLSQQLGSVPTAAANSSREELKKLEKFVKEMETQLKGRQDEYLLNAANKPLMQKVRIAREKGLADTALNLLLKADPQELHERRGPREPSGSMVTVMLLLGLGRIDEAREALVPDPAAASERRDFGIHPLGLPAYDWFRVQLGAADGDYAAIDAHLELSIRELEKNPVYTELLAQLDVLPASLAGRPGDRGTLAAALVGYCLLREAPQGAGLPWQWLRHLPYRLYPPHLPRRPETHATVIQGAQLLMQVQEPIADLWTLRAWFALEAGRIADARAHLAHALNLSDFGDDGRGNRVIAGFRSRPLAVLVEELIDSAAKPE
ncbi:MAG: hypothetical protein U0736_01855 [Gemmataceae bacterium]